MERTLAIGISLRARVFQPLSDIIVVRFGVNCFTMAAWLLAGSAALIVTLDVHAFLTSRLWAATFPIDALWGTCDVFGATHLLRFQSSADRTRFRIVHPVMHGSIVSAGLLFVVFAAGMVLGITSAYAFHLDWVEGTLHALRMSEHLPMAVGLMFGTCEWRKLPPSRKEVKGTLPGTAPSMS